MYLFVTGLNLTTNLTQELLHSLQACGRRIDRAVNQRIRFLIRRKRSQGHDQVLQFHHGLACMEAHHPTRTGVDPTFGGPSQRRCLAFRDNRRRT